MENFILICHVHLVYNVALLVFCLGVLAIIIGGISKSSTVVAMLSIACLFVMVFMQWQQQQGEGWLVWQF